MKCNELCPDCVDAPCMIEKKAPYVCNNCPKSQRCLFDKYLYNADYVHKEYLQKLHDSRKGIDLTRDELLALDELVSPLIKKGQPLVHIMQEHGAEIPCSIRTLYNYMDAGLLTARNIDMKRTVRYRKRRHYTQQPKSSYREKKWHDYNDYLEFIRENSHVRIVQMDTVEGGEGDKLLQTFLWTENNLMLAYFVDSK